MIGSFYTELYKFFQNFGPAAHCELGTPIENPNSVSQLGMFIIHQEPLSGTPIEGPNC